MKPTMNGRQSMTRAKMSAVSFSIVLASFCGANSAEAVTITLDEVQNDLVQVPNNVVVGALVLCEKAAANCSLNTAGSVSDIVFFDLTIPVGQTYSASLFSDPNEGGENVAADTANLETLTLPANVVYMPEVKLPAPDNGFEGALYTPVAGQPGFIPGQVTTYRVLSDAVPLPAAAWLFGAGLAGIAGIARRRVGHVA